MIVEANKNIISGDISEETKTGKWINKKPRWIPSISMTVHDSYECSNCGEPGIHWWKYCIYCGSPMEIDDWMKPIIECRHKITGGRNDSRS